MRVYTLGYQGLRIEDYLKILTAKKVGVILDVRETAWSYKKDFSKFELQKTLPDAGIYYIHVPSAGNPSANRKSARTLDECLARYRHHLRTNLHCLDELVFYLTAAADLGLSACLTCYESKFQACHRFILTQYLRKRIPFLLPVHLPMDSK